jgi:hypothetical protein
MGGVMRYFLSLFIAILGIGLALVACSDKPTDPGSGNANVFPHRVGDNWTYEIFDSTAATYDTVVVTIAVDTVLNNHSAKIWEYKYKSKADSTVVYIYGDTVQIYLIYPTIEQTPLDQYIFPLHVGDQWISTILMVRTEVVERGPVSTKVEDFEIGYRIQKLPYLLDNPREVNSWFVDYRGIVKMTIRYIDGEQHAIFWDLIDYNIGSSGS